MPSVGEPIFLDAGEAALVVEFGRTIEPAIHNRVLALDAALGKRALPGVVGARCRPSARLMIHYDPLPIDARRADRAPCAASRPVQPQQAAAALDLSPRCYDPPHRRGHRVDRRSSSGMTPEHVVALHSGATYRVYMYGFLPGFGLISAGCRKQLTIARVRRLRPPHRRAPHDRAPARRLITTFAMPTGWWRSAARPSSACSIAQREKGYVPRRVGDEISFEPIIVDAFAR